MTLEILCRKGTTLETMSSVPAAPPEGRGPGAGGGGIPNTSILWRPAPEPFAATAGLRRAVWRPVLRERRTGPGGGFGRAETLLTGTFTAKLTVNGRSCTQTFTVKPDPRNGEP